ncbi:BgtE-20061 [Blumeria graminis f. sp. tritici]|uniref:BgtE-20061 n=3 Tax=Blumeria graminis TaxID=34373 RepID=A0A9X9PS01_BLUGR|nr:BgtE-20061 [Blumeria graminis f. sp. tritici]
MHFPRLLNCRAIWFVSIIAVVQCFQNYRCDNNYVVTAEEIEEVYNKVVRYTNDAARTGKSLKDDEYRGNLADVPAHTYNWFITYSLNSSGNLAMDYFLLTSSSNEIVGVISTAFSPFVKNDDNWCTPMSPA